MYAEHYQNPHFDTQGAAIFTTQLREVVARTFDVKFPQLKARTLIPVSNEINPGAPVIEWRSYSSVGAIKLIAAYADDLPRSDVTGEQNFAPVRSLGGSYGYNIDEIAAALFSGMPLEQRKANAVRMAYELEVDRLAALGDAKSNLVGLLNITNATTVTIPNGASTHPDWARKTEQEIIDDMQSMITTPRSLTSGVEEVNTLVMPIDQYSNIATRRYTEVSDLTILNFFERTNPGIQVIPWFRAAGAGAGGSDRMVAYRRSPDVLQLHIPKELTPLEPEQRNLETVVNHHARFAGVICYYPLAVAYGDHI